MDMAVNEIMAANEILVPSVNANCQYSTRYCWEAEKVKSLIRLRAELSPLFTGKRNASKYAWAVVEHELNVPLPLSKIIKKWNNLLQEYKAIKMSEEPKRREWPFFTLMDVYFSDQVNDPSLRLFSSTKTLRETIDHSVFEDDPIIAAAIAAATSGAYMDIDELIRRQKERAVNDKKYTVGDYKYDMKPMMPNSKFDSNDVVKLSKSVDDLSMQQYKIKEEILRQREHEQQENIIKIKAHARQQQQQQQQQQRYHHQQQQQQQQQAVAAAAAAAQQQQQQSHSHRLQQPTPPPGLHALQQQQQQQHLLHQHQQHQQQQQQQQQQQRQQQQQQQQLQHQQQQQQQQQQQLQPPPPPTPTPPTTAQQIHIQTAQHQAAQQHLHQQQQQQQFTDPNTIDQYLLSWNNFHGNMCRGFHTLQKDEKMVDVTIAAGGKIFKAHKLVLSVCSPYFQQIFLENPSSHPILLMADVEASHMAGLLDFMYSGQVNVKYEDLPVFLKVAEAMKIKGLHTEKNMDDDSKEMSSPHDSVSESTECRFDRGTHSVNITGQAYGQTQIQQQQQHEHNNGILNGNNTSISPAQSFSSFRDHIKSKATLAETFMKNLSRNNNNSSNNNYNHLSNCGTGVGVTIGSGSGAGSNNNAAATETILKPDNFAILQANSKKILDSTRKKHNYLAKRKILMHYNDELTEKRMKEMERNYGATATTEQQHDSNNNNANVSSNQEAANDLETLGILMPQVPPPPSPSTQQKLSQATPSQKQATAIPATQHNNFKIRLMEKHQNATSNSNTNNNNATADNEVEVEEEEEEALNLVQNANETKRSTVRGETAAEVELMEIDTPLNENGNGNGKTQNERDRGGRVGVGEDDGKRKRKEYDDNNNNKSNTNCGGETDTDTNNNNNNNDASKMNLNKNTALINAINRTSSTMEFKKELLHHHQHEADGIDDEDDNNNNNNDNDSNNNQLDLSTVKNIATAEILCGLKSKVFKMEPDQEQQQQQHQRETSSCRKLNEIRNASE